MDSQKILCRLLILGIFLGATIKATVNDLDDTAFQSAITGKEDIETLKRYIDQNKEKYMNMAAGDEKNTPIFISMIQYEKHPTFFDYLIKNKADIYHRNKAENTTLHYAIQQELPLEKIKLLLGDNKQNLNLPNNHGYTPLYLALTYEKDALTLVKWLVIQGADLTRLYGGGVYDDDDDDDDKDTIIDVAKRKVEYEDDLERKEMKKKIVSFLEQALNGTKKELEGQENQAQSQLSRLKSEQNQLDHLKVETSDVKKDDSQEIVNEKKEEEVKSSKTKKEFSEQEYDQNQDSLKNQTSEVKEQGKEKKEEKLIDKNKKQESINKKKGSYGGEIL